MGTVTVHYIDNPLRFAGAERRTVECVGTVEDCVRHAFPELSQVSMVFVRYGREVQRDELCSPGDNIVVAYRPQAMGITAVEVGRWVVQALVYAAVSYLISALLKPKGKKNKQASPAYNVNIDQNAARLGGTVPVIYGRVLALPDIAAQPYSEFVAHNERVSMILCLGMGEYQINDIYLGESRVSDFPAGTVTTWLYPPTAHAQRLGVIEAQTGVAEDMLTVPESSGVDLAAPNDPAEITVAGSVSGGTLIPDGQSAATIWTGLVPGKKYVVANSAGGSVVATYVGIGPNNSAVFDTALPVPANQQTINITAQLTEVQDTQEGTVMLIYATANVPSVQINDIIYAEAGGVRRGPYQVYKFTIGTTRVWLRKTGPGFTSANDEAIWPQQAMRVLRNFYVTYSVTEWTPNTPTTADPYRWRGWYSFPRPGARVDVLFVDIVMPNGIAWITDKGDYNNMTTTFRVQIQRVDEASAPIGGVQEETIVISGATSNPRRISYKYPLGAPGRFRARIARINDRDQRASKEISAATLSAMRARIFHEPNAPAYEDATLLVMQFNASAGLAAASNRRIKVDATRRLPDLWGNGLWPDPNPALAVRDAYTNPTYGAGRPASEFDLETFYRLAQQWGTTPGFNGIFDQPTTVIEAVQAILSPVRAVPLPIGSTLSAAQDCPRFAQYVFGPETIVRDSLSLGYNFDGLDEPDCLEVVYNDPATFVEMRVFYPAQGAKPETIELFGCTNAQQAADWAKLSWQERQNNRKTCQFDLEGEGYLLEPLNRFGLVIPVVDRGSGGAVLEYAFPDVWLDGPYPTGALYIHFKLWDGTIGPVYLIDHVDPADPTHIVLRTDQPVPPAGVIHPSDQHGDATRWVAAFPTEQFFNFSVTNLEPAGPFRVRVTGMQYTDAKFFGTFVQGWQP